MPIEDRQVQKASDAVDIQEMRFSRPAREAHGDHSSAGQQLVFLPAFERQGREEVVVADNDVRGAFAGCGHSGFQSRDSASRQTQIAKIPRKMITQIRMSADAECKNIRLFTGHGPMLRVGADGRKSFAATGLSHSVDDCAGQWDTFSATPRYSSRERSRRRPVIPAQKNAPY